MKKNKKKIIIIIVSILLLLVTIGIILFVFLFKDKEENNIKPNDNTENKETIQDNKPIEYKYTKDGPGFLCSNKELYSQTFSYDKGDYVYCEIGYEVDGASPGITEIWFETTHDDNIEYIEIADVFDNWKLESKNGIIHLKSDTPVSFGDGLYKVKFRIIPSTQKEKLQISFKNIKYKNANDEYYQTDDSIIELTINKETNYKHEFSEKHDEINFYKFNKTNGYEKINNYKCTSKDCYEYATECTSYNDQDKGKLLILDGNKAVLYDFNKGILGTYLTGINMIENYFIVQDINNQKYGIIDLDGKIIKEFKSDGYGASKIAKCFNKNTYSLKYDLITEKKDNKYGIIKITKDETVIEHEFDDIRLYNDKYFKAKIDNNWYLYSIDTKEKVIEEGYKELFIANNEIVITQIDKYLYIKDYQGNNIIEDKIEVLIEYNENACCATPGGIAVKEENGIINIFIDEPTKEDVGYKQNKYEYNIKDKKLTKTK